MDKLWNLYTVNSMNKNQIKKKKLGKDEGRLEPSIDMYHGFEVQGEKGLHESANQPA